VTVNTDEYKNPNHFGL